jgi:hypothetical protein
MIERWWGRIWPDANIGARTGEASGLVVVDIDGEEGADSLVELESRHGQLPRTATVKTPRGGAHIYFQHPGVEVRPSVGELAPQVDVRGDGSYVLVPPSLGPNGRRYEPDEQAPLAPLPDWLLARIAAAPEARDAAPASDWTRILRDGVAEGKTGRNGELEGRNQHLARLVGHLLRRWVDVDVVAELAHLVNEHRFRPPLPADEVERVIESSAGRELHRREGSS